MRKAFILSLLIHLTLVSFLSFFVKDKTEIKKDIFYADLVSPDRGSEDKKADIAPLPKAERPSSRIAPPSQRVTKPTKKPQADRNLGNAIRPTSEGHQQARGYEEGDAGRNKRQGQSIEEPTAQPPISAARPSSGDGRQGGTPERKTLRERLFDRDVIKEIAKAEVPPPEKNGAITFDTKEFKYHGYLKRLRERIEGVWKYPQEAAERGIYGDLYLRFTVKKNGRLGEIELVRTSGHKMLDDAAIRALREADPFWPVPDELGKDAFTITGHFVYSIYGAYLR